MWLGWGMGLIECPYCERQVSEYTVVDGIELPTKVCPYYGRSPAGGERLDEKSVRQPETPAEQEITQADTRDGGGVAKPPKLRNTIDCVDCGGGESFLRRSAT